MIRHLNPTKEDKPSCFNNYVIIITKLDLIIIEERRKSLVARTCLKGSKLRHQLALF